MNANERHGLGVAYQMLMIAYVSSVVLFSYREDMTLVAKVAGVLLGTCFVFLLLAGRPIVFPMTYRIWSVWFSLVIAASLVSGDPGIALVRAMTLLQLVAVGFMLTNLLIWNRSTRFYWLGLIGAAMVSFAFVVLSPETFATRDGRVYGTLGNANTYGVLLSMVLALATVSSLGANRWTARVSFFGVAAMAFAMLLKTGSRTAMIGGVIVAGAVISMAYLYKVRASKERPLILHLLGMVVVFLVLFGLLTASPFWSRTEKALSIIEVDDIADQDASLAGRLLLARRALETALEHPLTGVGLDNFRLQPLTDRSDNEVTGTYAHNNYLEILVSTGFVGFLIYFSIYWLWIIKLYTLRRLLRDDAFFERYTMILVVIINLVVMDMASVSYASKMIWLILPWLVAEMHLLEQESSRRFVSRENFGAT